MPPGDYFIGYLPLIRNTIRHLMIVKGDYRMEQMDELVQKVSELLLIREKGIVDSYKGRARFSTFLTVVVENMCREIRKSEIKYRSRFISFSDIRDFTRLSQWFTARQGSTISSTQALMIGDAVTRLSTILRTYTAQRAKIEFCLKAIFRIPVHIDDLTQYSFDEQQLVRINKQIDALNDQGMARTKTRIYQHLTEIFEIIQHKTNSDDAIRKWIDDRMDEIIVLLNGDPPEYSFNRETFQYLFDYYCKSSTTEFQKIAHIQSNK